MNAIRFLCYLPLTLSGAIAHAANLPDTANEPAVEIQGETIQQRDVSSAEELVAAARDRGINRIVVSGYLKGLPSIRLSPGQTLTAVENLKLIATSDRRIIFNDTSLGDFGRFELRQLTLTGVVQLIATNAVCAGHVEGHDIDVVSADARGYDVRPKAYGVEVVTGAFTLWNQQLDASEKDQRQSVAGAIS
jgi:hypothetical protein